METISVIIPCRNEEKYISECLNSILNNDYPFENLEVFVVDGKSTDATPVIVENYSNKFGFIHTIINEAQTAPHALNLAINKSKGEFIIRIDAHSEIPYNYFSELIKWSKKLSADNIGTVCITDVKNKNPKSLSIRKVLAHKFGVGNSYFRIGIDKLKEVDTVPFGCYRRDVFEKIGLFDTRLTRNQDIELNKRIKQNGGKIILLPHLFCKYYARETFSGIAKNNFETGLWNILTIYFTKRINSISLRHFIPLVFLLSLILPLIIMIWLPMLGIISFSIFIIYIIITSIVSLTIKDKDSSFYLILFSFLVLHFSYGAGSFIGLFEINALFNRQKK